MIPARPSSPDPGVTDRGTGEDVRRSVAAGVGLVTAGSMVANIASYLLAAAAAILLGPGLYSEFASLLAAQLILAVPALALQTVIARDAVHGRGRADLRRLGQQCAAVVTVLAVVATPVVASVLDTAVITAAAALLTAPFLVLLATEQGLLQGQSRFGALGAVLAGSGVAKVGPVVLALLLGASTGPALAAGAVGTAVMAVLAHFQVDRGPAHVDTGEDPTRRRWLGVLGASQVQLVIVGLSTMDVVLARAVLGADDAGIYALGAVAAKAAFWLPQSVGVVLYPRMADPRQSVAAVRAAVTILLGIGAVVVVGAALAGPLVPLVFEEYAPVRSLVWLFACQGAALAVMHCALLAAVARGQTRTALVAWTALVVEMIVVVVFVSTPTQLVVVAATCAAVTSVVVTTIAWTRRV